MANISNYRNDILKTEKQFNPNIFNNIVSSNITTQTLTTDGTVTMNNLPTGSTDDVLFYNSSTGQITHGPSHEVKNSYLSVDSSDPFINLSLILGPVTFTPANLISSSDFVGSVVGGIQRFTYTGTVSKVFQVICKMYGGRNGGDVYVDSYIYKNTLPVDGDITNVLTTGNPVQNIIATRIVSVNPGDYFTIHARTQLNTTGQLKESNTGSFVLPAIRILISEVG